MKELLKELKPLKIKIILEIFVNWIMIGLMIGLGLSSIIIIISKFVFVDKILIKIFVALVIGLVFGLIMSVVKRPNIKKLAVVGDALGFKERFITAVEILNSGKKDEPISKLVIKDAVETAKNADFKRLYKINISNKRYIALALAILVIVVSGFIPSWKSEQIKNQAELQQNINKEINNIKELSNESKDAELKKELQQLKNELKKSKSTSEIVKAIQKTQQQLKKIENKSVAKDLKELGEKLSENELTKALGESLNSASSEDIKQQIEKIKDLINRMPKENLETLAKQINKMSDELSENNELKDLIKNLAENLNSSDYEKATGTIDNISTKLNQLSEENKEVRQATDKINKELNDSTKNMQNDAQQNNSEQPNKQNNQQQNNSEQSNKQNNQQQNNSSPSNQQGSSNQQGQEQSSNPSGSGGKRGHGSIPNENIYTRDLQNISGTEVQLQGQKNSGGTLEEAERKGDGEAGEIISYDKVYEQYKQDALKSLNEDNIPYGMKNLVEDYFSSLSLE